ncbi:MAG: ABC transporter permease subunit [Pseudoflavonifractor sp.]
MGKDLLLPTPLAVMQTLLQLVVTPGFWQTAGVSLVRIFTGFLGGTLLGALFAALTCSFSWADLLLSPAIRVIRATPVASFILLVLLWVKTGLVPGVCAGLMVLPVVWGNVCKGISLVDPQLLELARAYRFGRWKTLALVYIPSVLPQFAGGCATGLGLAWKAGVAAEVLCLPQTAIGLQIFNAKRYLETPALFAWTAVVILLSFLLENAFGRLFRRLERGRGA